MGPSLALVCASSCLHKPLLHAAHGNRRQPDTSNLGINKGKRGTSNAHLGSIGLIPFFSNRMVLPTHAGVFNYSHWFDTQLGGALQGIVVTDILACNEDNGILVLLNGSAVKCKEFLLGLCYIPPTSFVKIGQDFFYFFQFSLTASKPINQQVQVTPMFFQTLDTGTVFQFEPYSSSSASLNVLIETSLNDV